MRKALLTRNRITLSTADPFYLEERAEINEEFIDKCYYSVVHSRSELKKFEEMQVFFDSWIREFETSKFHKAPENKAAFTEFLAIRDSFERLFPNEERLFQKKFLFVVFNNLKTVKFSALEAGYSFNNETDASYNPDDCESESRIELNGFQSYYSKNFLNKLIIKDLRSWLFIIAYATETLLSINLLDRVSAHFLLYLEAHGFMEASSVNRQVGGRVVHLVRYDLNSESGLIPSVAFPAFYLNCNLYEPILAVNDFFDGLGLRPGSLLQIADYVFKQTDVFKKNPAYGYLHEEEITPHPDTDFSVVAEHEAPEFKYVKRSININVNLKKTAVLKHTISKDNQTKIYIDWEKFKKISEEFVELTMRGASLDFEMDESFLIGVLNSYIDLKNSSNKTFVNNLLIFTYLKLFSIKFKGKNFFYYLFSFDFRGRKYFESIISITNFKFARFFVHYGYYTKEELSQIIEDSLKSTAVKVLEPLLEKFNSKQALIDKSYFLEKNDERRQTYIKYLGVHFLIAIGVTFKSKLLSDVNAVPDGYTLTTALLFDKGYSELEKFILAGNSYWSEIEDPEDRQKLAFYFSKLLSEVDLVKKEMIGLDFSCSGHQLRYLIDNFVDKNSYSLINIAGWEKSVDLYSFILVSYKNLLKFLYDNDTLSPIDDPDLEKNPKSRSFRHRLLEVFDSWETIAEILSMCSRSVVKKSLMTCEYNAQFTTFSDYFTEEFVKKYGEKEYGDKKKPLLLILIGLYRFARGLGSCLKEFKSEQDLGKILVAIKYRGYVLELWDGFEVNFAVFKRLDVDKRVIVALKQDRVRKRHTYKTVVFSDFVDKKKTLTGLMPNFIHSVDGSIVRLINFYSRVTHGFLSIHDEFWIPYQLVFLFKDQVNLTVKLDLFSPVILDDYRAQAPAVSQHKRLLGDGLYCYNVIL